MAIRHTAASHNGSFRGFRKGFTLVKLLIVIAIIAILAAILFPAFARSCEMARRSSCSSNLKQIGISIMQCMQDNDERFPIVYSSANVGWATSLEGDLKSRSIFKCPADSRDVGNSYVMNSYFDARVQKDVQSPANTVLVVEGNLGEGGARSLINAATNYGLNADYSLGNETSRLHNPTVGLPRHLSTSNILWADGHFKATKAFKVVDNTSAERIARAQEVLPFDTAINRVPRTSGLGTIWTN